MFGTLYFRYVDSTINCEGNATQVDIIQDSGVTVVSETLTDNCTNIVLTLSSNHVAGTTASLYNNNSCSGTPTASLVNPVVSGNQVTYAVPAGVVIQPNTSWSVSYGGCSCIALDTSVCQTFDCTPCQVELIDNGDCTFDVEINGSGCANYGQLTIFQGSLEVFVDVFNGDADNYSETLTAIDGQTYFAELETVPAAGCDLLTDSLTMNCIDCSGLGLSLDLVGNTNAGCESIEATPSGGSGNYSYTYRIDSATGTVVYGPTTDNIFNPTNEGTPNQVAGDTNTYFVTVTDTTTGCEATAQISRTRCLYDEDRLEPGGTITVAATCTGGTSPALIVPIEWTCGQGTADIEVELSGPVNETYNFNFGNECRTQDAFLQLNSSVVNGGYNVTVTMTNSDNVVSTLTQFVTITC